MTKLLPYGNKRWERGRLAATYDRRPSSNSMGRFGGGWQWEVGVQTGGVKRAADGSRRCTVIVNLLVFSLRLVVRPRSGR